MESSFALLSVVALLAKGGLCSDEMKARHISMFVQPTNVVKFLIVDGSDEHGEDDNDSFFMKALKSSLGLIVFPFQRKQSVDLDDDINVSVLHVSTMAEFGLLDLLAQELPTVRASGGSLLDITGETSSDEDYEFDTFWIGIICVISAFGCMILMSLISKIVESTQPAPRPVARPRLRQLNPWQVRNRFPVGVFDGTQVDFSSSRRKRDRPDIERESTEDDGEIRTILDESCTICLDEFEAGDRVRSLPCGHTFHSKCIMKWMTERSATCPLCKADYYESDDEEDDDIVPSSAPLSGSWNSVPPEILNAQPQQSQEVTHESSFVRWLRRGRAVGIWGRGMFQRSRRTDQASDDAIQAALSEPLLSATEQAPMEGSDVASVEADSEDVSPPSDDTTSNTQHNPESDVVSGEAPAASAAPEDMHMMMMEAV